MRNRLPTSRPLASLLAAVLLAASTATAGYSQQASAPTDAPPSPTTTATPSPTPRPPLHSARDAMKTFLLAMGRTKTEAGAIDEALRVLDLSGIPEERRREVGAQRAYQLEDVISTLGLDLEALPDDPRAPPVVFFKEGNKRIVLARIGDRWQFTARTVRDIPELHKAVLADRQVAEEGKPSGVSEAFRSPRATFKTFLDAVNGGDLATAAQCLDLSEIPLAARETTGEQLAVKLKYVMDRIRFVVFQELPDLPDGVPYVWYVDQSGRIELERQSSGPRAGEWLFSRATVRSIEALYRAFEGRPIVEGARGVSFWTSPALWTREHLSSWWKVRILGIERWQWTGLLIVVLLGWLVGRGARLIARAVARRLAARVGVALADDVTEAFMRPLGRALMVVSWSWGLGLLDLTLDLQGLLAPPLRFAATLLAVWAVYKLIDLVAITAGDKAGQTASRLDDLLVPLLRKTSKVVITLVGLVLIARSLGFDPTTLVAGLGIGGLAFALAAQDTLRNLFGSLTVVLDQPFSVGDGVKIGNVEGSVESVGLRSTRIRTYYGSLVTVPNANLISANVDNIGLRRRRRFKATIGVTYETPPDKLDAFCEGIRDLVRNHPHTFKDAFEVHVNELGPSSIDILLYLFFTTPTWSEELASRHALILDILRLADRLGVSIAYPTRTIHLVRESGDERPS